MEEEVALNDADPSNVVSKKCKHGVKTLVDTIVDQPCQYGNVVIMSYGGYYDAYPMVVTMMHTLCGHLGYKQREELALALYALCGQLGHKSYMSAYIVV